MGREDSKRSAKPSRQRREKSPKPQNRHLSSNASPSKKSWGFFKSKDDHDREIGISGENVFEVLPPEYLRDRDSERSSVDPILHYLPKMASKNQLSDLKALLSAADDDIRLHRARLQAAKETDLKLLRSYQLEADTIWMARQQRLSERGLMLSKLDTERPIILKELVTPPTGLTAQEAAQVQLARWQRALELYVYSPQNNDEIGMLELLERLSEGVAEVSLSVRSFPTPSGFLGWFGIAMSWCVKSAAYCSSLLTPVSSTRFWLRNTGGSTLQRPRAGFQHV